MSNPPLYIATYSNVDVYECMVGDTALMRRVSDNWINATQILKAANFPKASRTRILEKEIQTGIHEKIQGGYGRFQGTWIPLEIARPLAHKYKITDAMAPILTYVPDPYNPLGKKSKGAGSGGNTSSQKRTDSAAKKQKSIKEKNIDSARKMAPSVADGSFWQANEPPRYQQPQQPNSYPQYHAPPPVFGQYGQQQLHNGYFQQSGYQQPQYLQEQQQGYPQHQTLRPPNMPQLSQQTQQHIPQQQAYPRNGSQSQAQQSKQQQQQQQQFAPYQQHKQKNSNENWSQDDANSTQMDEAMESDTSISSEHSAMANMDSKNARSMYTDALVHFFSNETDDVPLVLLHPPSDFDFNEPIDEEGHTPLHWASSMASPALVELLLKNGADPLTPNAAGLNCVSRAVFFNNSYQKGNFNQIVQLMKSCLYTPDKSGRTPLHYLCESTRSKTAIAQYYLQTILDQLSLGNENLITIVANHRDIQGDSAIDLCMRSGNTTLLDCLKSYVTGTESTAPNTPAVTSIRTPGTFKTDLGDFTEEPDSTINDRTDSVNGDHDDAETPGPANLFVQRLPKLPVGEVGGMLTSMLSSLADAYDTELKNKEEESEHTKSVLDNLQQDLDATESQNREVLRQIDSGLSLEELTSNISQLDEEASKKTDSLMRIMERSQALSMAKIVLREESSIDQSFVDNGDQIQLAFELTQLQVNRTRVIDTIIQELAVQNTNNKMNNYRKLIALACDLKAENVDELVDEIEADLLTTMSN